MNIIKKIENKLKDIGKVIGIIFLYFLLQVILINVFRDCLTSDNKIVYTITELSLYLILIIVISLFFIKDLVKDFHEFKKSNIKIAFKNWGLGFLCMFLSNLYLTYFLGNIANNEASNRAFLTANPILAFLLMVFLAPALEELVFRLNVKKGFKNKYVFCFASALLFGGMHLLSSASLIELLYIIPYGSLGFFFAKAYYETDNIYTSILAHSFHNCLTVIIILLGTALL